MSRRATVLRESEITRDGFEQDVRDRWPEYREPIRARDDALVQQTDDGRATRAELFDHDVPFVHLAPPERHTRLDDQLLVRVVITGERLGEGPSTLSAAVIRVASLLPGTI